MVADPMHIISYSILLFLAYSFIILLLFEMQHMTRC